MMTPDRAEPRSDAGERREPEVFEGRCYLREPGHPLLSNRNNTDIAFVLCHRYVGKRVRITVEVIDEPASQATSAPPRCKLCGEPRQSWQVFCGAACSVRWECGERPASQATSAGGAK